MNTSVMCDTEEHVIYGLLIRIFFFQTICAQALENIIKKWKYIMET